MRRLFAITGATLIGAGTLVTACAPRLGYQLPAQIDLGPASLDAAREASRKVDAALARDGDFHTNDLVRLSFPYLPLLDGDQRVQPSGVINPPLLDPIQTRGLTSQQLRAELIRRYRTKLERPEVSVSVVSYGIAPVPPEIFVLGEVLRPGAVPYREGTTLFEALARAGGGNREAELRQIVVIQPDGDALVARLVDLKSLLTGTDRAGDPLPARTTDYLHPYSIVIVPPTKLARDADLSRTVRNIIGFSGVSLGTALRLSPN